MTQAARPIYSENGQFYYTRNNGATWRRLANTAEFFTWAWEPNVPGNYNNVNLFGEGTVANLKRNYNWAARTIQKAVRNRRTRRAATTIQRRVRGVQLRARAGWNNPYTPVGYLAMMKRLMRLQKEISAHGR
jgi:hypothetical protein